MNSIALPRDGRTAQVRVESIVGCALTEFAYVVDFGWEVAKAMVCAHGAGE